MIPVKIFRLFIILLISAWVTSPAVAREDEASSARAASDQVDGGLFRGIYLSVDAFGYIYPVFVKDAYYSAEVSATLNIRNRIFPVVEVGMGYADMVSHLYDIGYRTRAPYYRIGMDYNMQYKNGRPNYIYLGARVGYASFRYSVDAPPLFDPVWGDEAPVQFVDVPCRTIWAEAVGGVRAEIVKNFYMGWSLRYKYPLFRSADIHGGPWYIPGFGVGKKGVLGATYTISYYFKL